METEYFDVFDENMQKLGIKVDQITRCDELCSNC